MNLLECKRIGKVYLQGQTHVQALDGVSFSVSPGEFVCVRGRSGSGKTTLLNCLGTLDSLSEGELFLDGISIGALSESKLLNIRRETFGFVFQEPRLFGHLSILDNVALPLVFRGATWKCARLTARSFVFAVGLRERLDQPARLVSGGEALRAGIARALAHSPRILLADEPTGELDTQAAGEIVEMLGTSAKTGTAVIVASHDPMVAEKAGRIIGLQDGRIA